MKPPVLYQSDARLPDSPLFPSAMKARVETQAVARLAADVHDAGLQFAAWPTVTITPEPEWDSLRVHLEVWAIPRELVPT